MYRDLYAGGMQLKANAAAYLSQRQKEPADVYGERLSHVFYENYIGSIIDWYAATVFRREPLLTVDGINQTGRQFFAEFAEDCDRKGTGLTDFFRRRMVDALIQGRSYMLVDFPRTDPGQHTSGGRSGGSLASLPGGVLRGGPGQLEHRRQGNYDWIVLRETLRGRSAWTAANGRRRPVALLRPADLPGLARSRGSRRETRRTGGRGSARAFQTVESAAVRLKRVRRVVLMNKAGQVQWEHFNKSNALAWALTMGLFATPVVYSERTWNQIVGESIHPTGTERQIRLVGAGGKVYQIAADNLNRLKEEIYRVSYLLTQAGD